MTIFRITKFHEGETGSIYENFIVLKEVNKMKTAFKIKAVFISGGEGNRTPVQTYSPKAFYMLIPLLIVGK